LNRLKKLAQAKLALVVAALCAAAMLAPNSASAGTYYYCSSCVIGASSVYEAPAWAYINLDYVHRISGPGSGVQIGAIAQYADDGSWGNWAASTATEVTHGYSGTRKAWGIAGNFGAGNYAFNAHVNY
jgi:hypothetical protein